MIETKTPINNFSYTIHHTGSSGNVARIDYNTIGILIDIGKPYKLVSQYLEGISYLFISHRHSDHLNLTTYKTIRERHPYISIVSNGEVNEHLMTKGLKGVDVIIKDDMQLALGDLKITCLNNYHDTETHGFIFESPHETLLFATDLSTTTDYELYLNKVGKKVDICLLEANYKEEVLDFYISEGHHTGFDIFSNGSQRHLSVENHQRFVAEHVIEGGCVRELHTSSTYRTFKGLLKKSKGKISIEMVEKWLTKNGKPVIINE